MKSYWFASAYLPGGWEKAVKISVTETGYIDAIATGASPEGATAFSGFALPGFPNIHSHAFQRAMTGLSEVTTSPKDTFWTWRNVMYQYANAITPSDQTAIAAQLYMEMLKTGYTSVGEFHYLHHRPDGTSFDHPTEMSDAVITAAEQTGIGLTHLPVLYMSGDFGNAPLKPEQGRFFNNVEHFQRLLCGLSERLSTSASARLGIAFHSLRAVPPEAIAETLTLLNQLDDTAPIHIHVAEQTLEVEACIRWSGRRPVEWLLEHCDINNRWCLVHATHLNDGEIAGIATSGAVVGLCPTTEANLGDGLFPMPAYLRQGGKFAIGSDSNTSVSPIEELRWLEYGQRLAHRQRNVINNNLNNNVLNNNATPHTARCLVDHALADGAAALGRQTGALAAGHLADVIVLEETAPCLYAKPHQYLLDALVFSGNVNCVRDVLAAGKWVVKNYRHICEDKITGDYFASIKRLQKY